MTLAIASHNICSQKAKSSRNTSLANILNVLLAQMPSQFDAHASLNANLNANPNANLNAMQISMQITKCNNNPVFCFAQTTTRCGAQTARLHMHKSLLTTNFHNEPLKREHLVNTSSETQLTCTTDLLSWQKALNSETGHARQ